MVLNQKWLDSSLPHPYNSTIYRRNLKNNVICKNNHIGGHS